MSIHPLEKLLDLMLCRVREGNLVVDAAGANECFVKFFGVIGC